MTLAASLMFIMCIGYIQFYVGLFFFFFCFLHPTDVLASFE